MHFVVLITTLTVQPIYQQVIWCTSQLTFTRSKPTIETLEKGVKHVQS